MEVHMLPLVERHGILRCSTCTRPFSKSSWMEDFRLQVQARPLKLKTYREISEISGPALEQLDPGTSLLLPLDCISRTAFRT